MNTRLWFYAVLAAWCCIAGCSGDDGGSAAGTPSGSSFGGDGTAAPTGAGGAAGDGPAAGSASDPASGSDPASDSGSGSASDPASGSDPASDSGSDSDSSAGPGSGAAGSDPGRTADGPGQSSTEVAVDETPGSWRTGRDQDGGRFVFISPEGQKAVLQGVSMTGMETGTRNTAAGAGFWLYNAPSGDQSTEAPRVVEHVVDVLTDEWNSDVVRIPICGSAWTQNYLVKDWGEVEVGTYKDWVDVAVQRARAAGKVVIIDLHLWAIAKMSKGTEVDRGSFERGGQTYRYEDWEDGCNGINDVDGTDSCAPQDWYTEDPARWECAIANADGITLHNAHKNRDHIAAMWTDVATRYATDDGVWFELFNEPYTRKAPGAFPGVGENEEEPEYPWDLWTQVMDQWIRAIRDDAGASNIIIVNGLDWGYSFGPDHGPIADPDTYLPWKSAYANIAYGFHPYQHGSCCGAIGASGEDESASDPYQAGYCAYYPGGETWGQASGAALPGGAECIQNGYAATQDKKMPPCHWVEVAFNPATGQPGLCAGDRQACSHLDRSACDAMDWSSFEAGGWSRYVLPMAEYGPLIATEFGTFDCSSPFVTTFLRYMREHDISYTAWALWPQNSGGPGGLGACGYPSVMSPSSSGDFRECHELTSCESLISPMPWAGEAVYQDITSR